jgi:hypothetical protein
MSASNAAARKRRAPPQTEPMTASRQMPQQAQPNVNSSGLTLPQVITIIDKRLIQLETYVREQKSAPTQVSTHASTQASQQEDSADDNAVNNAGGDQLNNIIQEYNSRFELLAEEIGNLKDIVLKLQSYTLEVNKTLMEERINVFSDMGDSRQLSGENLVLEQMDDGVTSADIRDMVNDELFLE